MFSLGLAGLVFDRPQPGLKQDSTAIWPAPVQKWTNLAGSGDVVAPVRKLAPRFRTEFLRLPVDDDAEMHGMASPAALCSSSQNCCTAEHVLSYGAEFAMSTRE
ncbi:MULTISPECIES: hypothetical protein [Streptomyces]|uniref:hypothetical protein n=1 Tax=Streptomyces TaxID=1883 RepID=UPI003437B3F9